MYWQLAPAPATPLTPVLALGMRVQRGGSGCLFVTRFLQPCHTVSVQRAKPQEQGVSGVTGWCGVG